MCVCVCVCVCGVGVCVVGNGIIIVKALFSACW